MATNNVFKSSTIFGVLRNSDNTTASPNINANAIFDRNISVTGKINANRIDSITGRIDLSGSTIDLSGNNVYLGHTGANVYIKDVLYTAATGDVTKAGTNAFTGTNTFNTSLPTSTFVGIPSPSTFLTKQNADNLYAASGSAVTTTGFQTLTNKTLTNPIISSISNSGTLTLPSGTSDTLVARNTSETLTNKTLISPNLTGTPTAITAQVGTNTTQIATTQFVLANSGGSVTLDGNNVFTGTNTFNTNLPTSTQTPTTDAQLVTKKYTDTIFQTIANMSGYLTLITAQSTYQTIANMVNYVTIASTNIITGINFFTNKVYINSLDTSTNLIGFNNCTTTAITANVVRR